MEAILVCHPARSTKWLDFHPKSCERNYDGWLGLFGNKLIRLVLFSTLQGSASATASSAATPPHVNALLSNASAASAAQTGLSPRIAPAVTSSVSAAMADAPPAPAVSTGATMQCGMPPDGPGMSSDRSGQTRDAGATHTGGSDRHTGPVQAANLPAGGVYAGEKNSRCVGTKEQALT